MKLLTKALKKKLLSNSASGKVDHKPVVKYFNPTGSATWLISEMDSYGIMFGLADLGTGTPELGYVSLKELSEVRVLFGLGIERDLSFRAHMSLSEYEMEARRAGRIVA